MERKFEIPFNHDYQFLQYLIRHQKILNKYIAHIFIAPFQEDFISTRHKQAIKPIDRQQYEEQIQQLQNAGYKIAILFNMPTVPSDKLIDYYINKIGASSFIINKDEVAQKIKDRGITTIASITKRLQLKDILEKDLSMYDYIVLDYMFNVNYNWLEKLPDKYKYILMVNTYCDYTCNFMRHWKEDPTYICPRMKNGFKNTTYIQPKDLDMFDKYISIYKLQGREYPTEQIETEILEFIFQNPKYAFQNDILKTLDYYNRGKFYKGG